MPENGKSWNEYAKYVVCELTRLDRWCKDNTDDISKVRMEVVEEAMASTITSITRLMLITINNVL